MNNLTWIKLQSNNLKKAAYDTEKDNLFIEFKDGIIYKYYDVPYEHFVDLINAPSKREYHERYLINEFKYVQWQ